MTHMLKKQTSMGTPPTPPSGALAMHKNSRMISKIQPKIRIIHIFAPEIIKTDVANFRELVQQLTGKPSPENNSDKGRKGKGKKVKPPLNAALGTTTGHDQYKPSNNTVSTKLEVMMMGSTSSPSSSSDHHHHHHHHNHNHDHHHHQQHDDHLGVWRSSSSSSGEDHSNNNNNNNNNNISSSGGYLNAFSDLDYDFNSVFHMGSADGSSHLNAFGA